MEAYINIIFCLMSFLFGVITGILITHSIAKKTATNIAERILKQHGINLK